MKKLLLLTFLAVNLLKAQDSILVNIPNWKDNKKAAIVFTFDDWSPGHGAIVYPLFKKYGLPATFFVTTKNKGISGGYETMKNAYADGFEIGNHTHNHPDLSRLKPEDLHQEVYDAQTELRRAVNPKCANTFAYPFGVSNTEVIAKTKASHIAARDAGLSYGRMWKYSLTYGKTDYFRLQTFMASSTHSYSLYNRLTKSAAEQSGMIVFMYHSIYNDSVDDHWFGAISEELLNLHVKAVNNHRDSVWITTFERAIMYHKEKAKTNFSVKPSKNKVVIDLNCSLNPDQYFEPITVQLKGIDFSKVKLVKSKNDKKKLEFISLPQGDGIQFNALPYNNKIIVEY